MFDPKNQKIFDEIQRIFMVILVTNSDYSNEGFQNLYGLDPELDCVVPTIKAVKKFLNKTAFKPKGKKMDIYESHNQTKEELS